MQPVPKQTADHQKQFWIVSWLTVVLLAIAYATHLTYLEIDPRLDEVRRALVSLEMMLRHNYWVPTINGEEYLNKPPLYNWLLVLSYKCFGVNEFGLRFPVYLSIFWFGWLIYFFAKKFIDRKIAMLAALLFISNGRILIYDSLIGLIDILYSSLVFLSFMLVYHYGKKEKWYHLFLSTYLLVVVGYLMKGLPSFIYQAFVLMVFFLSEKKWKKLFHPAHFTGIALMVTLLGIYYYFYFKQVNLSPAVLFGRLVSESTMRTYQEEANWIKDFLLHFITYPIEFAYHYAPWTIFLLLVIRRHWLKTLRENSFVYYNAILFFACFFIYWFSPYIIARYMFMLLPLCFIVAAWYHEAPGIANERFKRILDYLLMIVMIVAGFGCLGLPFLSFTNHLPAVGIKSVLVALLLISCGYLAYKSPALRLSYLILAIVCSRFGFNWFVVEQRGKFNIEQRHFAEQVMAVAGNRPIFLEKGADYGNPDGLSYHISLNQQRVLPIASPTQPGAVYITDSASMVKKPHTVLMRWGSEFQANHYLVSYDDVQ